MLIDTHAHLEMREFNDDRDDVIKRAKGAGVEYIVTIGTTVESCRDAVMLADNYDFIYAAIGIHPHEAKDILHPAYEILRHFAQHKKVVAYGEIGLDYYRNLSPPDVQRDALRRQLRLAREHARAELAMVARAHEFERAGDRAQRLVDLDDEAIDACGHAVWSCTKDLPPRCYARQAAAGKKNGHPKVPVQCCYD